MSKMFEYIQNQIRQSVNGSVENRIMYCRLYRGSIAIDLSMSFPFSAADSKRISEYLNMSDTFNSGKAAAETFCRYYGKAIELFQEYKRHIDSIRFTKSDEKLIADCERMIRKLVRDYNIIAAAFDVPAVVSDPGAAGAKWYFQRIMNALLLDHLQPLVNTMQPFKKRSAAVFDTS